MVCCETLLAMTYLYFLTAHSIFRWLVLLGLLFALIWFWRGYAQRKHFGKADDAIRHWTATISHIQLMLGLVLYGQSPMAKYYLSHPTELNGEPAFFGLLHMVLMVTAIALITLGSARAKRVQDSGMKFRVLLVWYGLALLLILAIIPWPFSPLAHRPWIRTF